LHKQFHTKDSKNAFVHIIWKIKAKHKEGFPVPHPKTGNRVVNHLFLFVRLTAASGTKYNCLAKLKYPPGLWSPSAQNSPRPIIPPLLNWLGTSAIRLSSITRTPGQPLTEK